MTDYVGLYEYETNVQNFLQDLDLLQLFKIIISNCVEGKLLGSTSCIIALSLFALKPKPLGMGDRIILLPAINSTSLHDMPFETLHSGTMHCDVICIM